MCEETSQSGNREQKLDTVVGGVNTRMNWGLDNPKFSGRGTGVRSFALATDSVRFMTDSVSDRIVVFTPI